MNSSDKPEAEDSDEIINDLESIKHLLHEDEEDAAAQPVTDDDVPLLDDLVEGGVSVNENMADDTFNTLLGDAWQDSVEDLFNNARSHIEENSTAWLPEHTDELSEALKVRIDASVRTWLAETLQANIGLLRERIVSELSTELLIHLRDKLGDAPAQKDKEPDHG